MKQKHFMDIARIKEEETDLAASNTNGFAAGDHIVIQEKVDGANASFRYDRETKTLQAFSRKQQLSFDKTLNGFWNYIQGLDPEEYEAEENYVFFGEWLVKNAIRYQPEAYFHWYVYDIYDTTAQVYLPQTVVKEACERHGWIYVDTFYDGPFISWEHCRSFVGRSAIALELGEGVVVKNQSKLNEEDTRLPFVLKIVGDHFSEIKHTNRRERLLDPKKELERSKAMALTEQIVTKRRVEKELFKMRDEGLLPVQITPQDMKIVAQNLPRRIYEDCMKEEKDTVIAAGEYFGKMANFLSMRYAKEIVLGGDACVQKSEGSEET